MHVAHVNCAFSTGQAPSDVVTRHWTLHRLAATQAAQPGVEVTVLQHFHFDADFERDGVRYILRHDLSRAPVAKPWSWSWSLHLAVKRLTPDIFHVHGLMFPVQTALIRHVAGRHIPIVAQHHGGLPWSGFRRLLQRMMSRHVDGFLFNGAGNAEPWLRAGVVPAMECVAELLEASSDLRPEGYREARTALGLDKAPVVLWVARLLPDKDPWTALAGFERAFHVVTDARLFMAFRESDLRGEIEAWIAARPVLAARIKLLGPVVHTELARWYSAADVFLTASRREGSNYALIESQSCGAAAVCSDIAPHRYIGGAAITTRFFSCGDAEACGTVLASALCACADGKCRADVLRHFDSRLTWRSIARRSLDIYQEIIDRHAVGSANVSRTSKV